VIYWFVLKWLIVPETTFTTANPIATGDAEERDLAAERLASTVADGLGTQPRWYPGLVPGPLTPLAVLGHGWQRLRPPVIPFVSLVAIKIPPTDVEERTCGIRLWRMAR
jgi:hypothetical protein